MCEIVWGGRVLRTFRRQSKARVHSPLFFLFRLSRDFKSLCYDLDCNRPEWRGHIAQNIHYILFPTYVSCWNAYGMNTIDDYPRNDIIEKFVRKSKFMTRNPGWHFLSCQNVWGVCFWPNSWVRVRLVLAKMLLSAAALAFGSQGPAALSTKW